MGVGEIERRVDFLALVRTEIFLRSSNRCFRATSFASVLEKGGCVRASDDPPIIPVCTENLIRVADVMETPKLVE
jgi:hypothetical protein